MPMLQVQQRPHAALATGCSLGKSSPGSSAHLSISLFLFLFAGLFFPTTSTFFFCYCLAAQSG